MQGSISFFAPSYKSSRESSEGGYGMNSKTRKGETSPLTKEVLVDILLAMEIVELKELVKNLQAAFQLNRKVGPDDDDTELAKYINASIFIIRSTARKMGLSTRIPAAYVLGMPNKGYMRFLLAVHLCLQIAARIEKERTLGI